MQRRNISASRGEINILRFTRPPRGNSDWKQSNIFHDHIESTLFNVSFLGMGSTQKPKGDVAHTFTNPLIPLRVVDAPTQRVYIASVFVAVQVRASIVKRKVRTAILTMKTND